MEIEDLIKKIDANIERIDANAKKIEDNFEKIQKNSYALEFIKDYKADSKKWFVILLIVLVMWFITIGYLVYVLNDTGTIETIQQVEDVEAIGGNVINNGE